jgi:hypothetical protein
LYISPAIIERAMTAIEPRAPESAAPHIQLTAHDWQITIFMVHAEEPCHR